MPCDKDPRLYSSLGICICIPKLVLAGLDLGNISDLVILCLFSFLLPIRSKYSGLLPVMASTTTTAVELQHNPGQERQLKHTDAAAATPAPAPDDVMQASIVADSQVPDGGQGWVVIAACAVVTW